MNKKTLSEEEIIKIISNKIGELEMQFMNQKLKK